MCNWIKNIKTKREIRRNINELKDMLLTIKISQDASNKELETFYDKIAIWDKVLTDKPTEFFVVMGKLSSADKLLLLNHIETCINDYGIKMIKLNEALLQYLDEEKLSQKTKVEIAVFGKQNVTRAEQTLTTLRNLAKYITLSK